MVDIIVVIVSVLTSAAMITVCVYMIRATRQIKRDMKQRQIEIDAMNKELAEAEAVLPTTIGPGERADNGPARFLATQRMRDELQKDAENEEN